MLMCANASRLGAIDFRRLCPWFVSIFSSFIPKSGQFTDEVSDFDLETTGSSAHYLGKRTHSSQSADDGSEDCEGGPIARDFPLGSNRVFLEGNSKPIHEQYLAQSRRRRPVGYERRAACCTRSLEADCQHRPTKLPYVRRMADPSLHSARWSPSANFADVRRSLFAAAKRSFVLTGS